MAIIVEPERSKLYRRIKALLGAPVRGVELEDEQMDSLLELSIGDYEQYILDWLIEAQWTSLYGMNLDEQSLSRALTKRSLDWETQYTYAYSKIVGLQAGGDSVLKKDYVDLVRNQQIYEIPAGREINEVLWFTPPSLNNLLFSPWTFGSLGGYTAQQFVPRGEITHIQNLTKFGNISSLPNDLSFRINDFWITYTKQTTINQFNR